MRMGASGGVALDSYNTTSPLATSNSGVRWTGPHQVRGATNGEVYCKSLKRRLGDLARAAGCGRYVAVERKFVSIPIAFLASGSLLRPELKRLTYGFLLAIAGAGAVLGRRRPRASARSEKRPSASNQPSTVGSPVHYVAGLPLCCTIARDVVCGVVRRVRRSGSRVGVRDG